MTTRERTPRPIGKPFGRAARIGAFIGAASFATSIGLTGGTVAAHEADIDSDPVSGAQVDEQISEVFIEFNTPVGDDTEITVLDPDEVPLDSETTLVTESAAVVTFDPIEQGGVYIARYLAPSIEDGHLIIGAISFTHGTTSSGPSPVAWILLGLTIIVILSIGAWFSFRRYRALTSADRTGVDDSGVDESDVDDDLSDVGV